MSSSTECLNGDIAGRSIFSSISAMKLLSCIEELPFPFLTLAAWMLMFTLAAGNHLE